MNFFELLLKRESVRRYSNKPVASEDIEQIMEACRLAPSACNSQPWRFVVVTAPELREKVARATYGKVLRFNRFVLQAPVIVPWLQNPPIGCPKLAAASKTRTST